MEFCLIYEDWWLFEGKAFYALREKAKIGSWLKVGLGMCNIKLK